MGGLFGKPKKPKESQVEMPAPVAPPPVPRELDEEIKQKERDRRRQRLAAFGRQGTILTQGQPLTGTATILGRSTG